MYSPALNSMPVTFASRYSSRAVPGFLWVEAVSPSQPPKIPRGGSYWRSPSQE